jgi:2-keto-3-deoxy-L-rhamnonate aldolase RhmA
MIVAMIESPAGVAIADQIAAVPGVDAVFIASTDLGSFSGLKQGDPAYEKLVSQARDGILAKGRKVGGPHAWKDRPGYHFFQSSTESGLIKMGAEAMLKGVATTGQPKGVAPIEGKEHH